MELTGKRLGPLFRPERVISRGRELDDDTYLNKSRDKLGDIKLTLHRTRPGVPEPVSSIYTPPEDLRVHERSKKGLSHCVACVIDLSSFRNVNAYLWIPVT
jgi:hypothetical protein